MRGVGMQAAVRSDMRRCFAGVAKYMLVSLRARAVRGRGARRRNGSQVLRQDGREEGHLRADPQRPISPLGILMQGR